MYIPIYNKTTYTFLSSLLEVDDLIAIALKNNLDSIAICDDNMFGVMEFIKKCQLNKLNPIVGVDFQDRLLFARNYQGYQNLLKLTSINSKKKLEKEDYFKYKDNLICIPLKEIDIDYDIVFYPYDGKNINKNSIYLSKLLYKEKDDHKTLKYLELLRDNMTINDSYIDKKDCYYKVNDIDNEAFKNTYKLASLCHLELPVFSFNLVSYNSSIDPNLYLKNLSYKGLKKRLNDNVPSKYLERLKMELEVIIEMGYANYFLVVYDFIKYAKNRGILVGPGRGSGAGSLVCYTLGITEIDPLKYDLLFERFLNKERITMPDIDTDFPDIYRDEIINYVKERYGINHVANIITFLAMGAKMCIRDIGRVMKVSDVDVNYITKLIGSRKESLKELINEDIRLKNYLERDNKLKKLIEIASKVEGIKRHTSIHAAGIIMSDTSLDKIVPMVYDENSDMYISGYEASFLEDLGLLKMDFLGIKNLTTIMEIQTDILRYNNVKVEFKDIPLDDKEAIKLFQDGDTNGIFQFESLGMKNFLRELKPNSFMDLSNAIALFRPGPAASIPSFIKRKEGLEKVDYFTPSLEPILKSTYGIIIYQEQIMQIANKIAGFTLGESDILRRAMSKKKKELIEEQRNKFIEGSIKNGYDKNLAIKIYDLIEKFALYGFNKSHSIAYTMIAYKMAYLKVHYKEYFYVNLLNSVIGDIKKTKEYLYEMKKYKLEVLKPDIRDSSDIYVIKNGNILAPFNIIKGISKVISSRIIDNRKEVKDIYEFFKNNLELTKSNYEILILAGCFENFGYNRKTLIDNLDSLLNYASLCKDLEESYVLKPEIIETKEYSRDFLIEKERDIYGFYLSNHPVTYYKSRINNIISLKDLEKYFNTWQNFIVLVESYKEIETKNGEKMLFFSGSDEERVQDFTVFPKTYKEYGELQKGEILKIFGKVEKRNGVYQVIVSKIERLKEEEDEKNEDRS